MQVLVVGSGLSGLALAIGLVSQSDNIVVDIIEKRETFDRRGATFGLAPNGYTALNEISPRVIQKLQLVGIPMKQNDHSLGGIMLPWWEVHDALWKEVIRLSSPSNNNNNNHHDDDNKKYPKVNRPRIRLHMGLKYKDISETSHPNQSNNSNCDGNHVVMTFHNSNQILRGSVLVGADGVRSTVRTHVLGWPPSHPTGTYTWRGTIDVRGHPDLHHLLNINVGTYDIFGSHLLVFYFHFPTTGRVAWTARTRRRPTSPPPCQNDIIPGVTTPLDLLQEYIDESSVGIDQEKDDAIRTAKRVFQLSLDQDLKCSSELSVIDLADGWAGKGRMTLIGDAAHAIRPYSGLGGSMAFEDAVILSQMLSQIQNPQSEEEVTETLRQFEAKRLPRLVSISKDQTTRSTSFYRHGNGGSVPPWSQAYRDWICAGHYASSFPPVEEIQHIL
jgi:2-polyprenyl-6-methoxyphenol hydroxylase-like FAD-dependent oxidoreductase